MPYIEKDTLDKLEQASLLLNRHHTIITTALRHYAEHMNTAAAQVHEQYKAGTETPLVTNQGYRMMSEMFGHNAKCAQQIADEVSEWAEA